MEFIDHTLAWCRGEIFEGKMVALFGLTVLIISFLYWKFGSTPFAKAMILPMLVVGVLNFSAGAYLIINNHKRIENYPAKFKSNPIEFITSEKSRVENFSKLYPIIAWTMSGVMLIGIVTFLLIEGANGRAIGLALILFSFSLLFLDHFSTERAQMYYKEILTKS